MVEYMEINQCGQRVNSVIYWIRVLRLHFDFIIHRTVSCVRVCSAWVVCHGHHSKSSSPQPKTNEIFGFICHLLLRPGWLNENEIQQIRMQIFRLGINFWAKGEVFDWIDTDLPIYLLHRHHHHKNDRLRHFWPFGFNKSFPRSEILIYTCI